jgi:hypothetical protein
VESHGRERLMMDGKASRAVRSEIHSLEARGVNSAIWVQERAGHGDQGSNPRLEHPSPGFPHCTYLTLGLFLNIRTSKIKFKNQSVIHN